MFEETQTMSEDGIRKKSEHRDFFVSYTSSDQQWAEWIAFKLEEAGFTVFIQAWDFRPGSNFVAEMDHAARSTDRTLLVLSPAYLLSDIASAEWATAFRHDSKGTQRKVLPVRVKPCNVDGLLGSIVFIDLVSLKETQACSRLLAGIESGRVKPAKMAFPELPRETPAAVPFPGALPAYENLPFPRNRFFTGREELLERLHTQLHMTQTTVALSQPQAINGLGGIGKTQIAIEYAHRYLGEYQAVLWARADTIEVLYISYTKIAELLHLPQKDAKGQEVVVQSVRNWLSNNPNWLLILDNADEPDLVRAFLPTRFEGHILLTTRSQVLGKLARRLEVEILDSEMGALLLLRRACTIEQDKGLDSASPSDRAIAMALTEELGGLPLALDQAGAYIEETQCSLEDYQRQYLTRKAELLALRGGGSLTDDHPESVVTTWSLSFAKVEAANPIAAELLRICAFLAPDAIPEELLMEALKIPLPVSKSQKKQSEQGGWFSLLPSGQRKKPELVVSSTKEGLMDEVVASLRAYSLIQRNGAEKTWSIHRLVQVVLLDTMSIVEQGMWVERVVTALNALFPNPEPERETTTWKQCERLVIHTITCDTHTDGYKSKNMDLHLASLFTKTAHYLTYRAQYPEADQLFQRAIPIYERCRGPEHAEVAMAFNNLGSSYLTQGKFQQAEEPLRHSFLICQQHLDPRHPCTLRSLTNLGICYQEQRNYKDAEPLCLQALSLSEEVLGSENPDLLYPLNNLAHLYQTQGRYEEAESLLQRALDLVRQGLSSEHPNVALALTNRAAIYDTQGKLKRAAPLYEEGLKIRQKQLGSEHPDTVFSLIKLAALYQRQGRDEQVKLLFQEAPHIRELVLGSEHPNLGSLLNDLASIYINQGKYEEAEPLLQRSLSIYERLNPEHLELTNALNLLASIYINQGKYEEAEPLLQRSLSIYKRLNPEHPELITTLNFLASIYISQGKYEQAESLLRHVLYIGELVLGPEHFKLSLSLTGLALIYDNQGKYEQAEPLFQRSLSIYQQHLGSDHPSTVRSLNGLAFIYINQGKYEQALAIYEQTLGASHPLTIEMKKEYDMHLPERKQTDIRKPKRIPASARRRSRQRIKKE